MMMMLADIRDIDVGDPGHPEVRPLPGLLRLLLLLIHRVLAGSVVLLILEASVGAVRSLKMVIIGVGRPNKSSSEEEMWICLGLFTSLLSYAKQVLLKFFRAVLLSLLTSSVSLQLFVSW